MGMGEGGDEEMGDAVLTLKNRQRCTPETLPTGYRKGGGQTESRRGQNTRKAKQERGS